MKKRLFAIMLTICMVVALAPMEAWAAEPTSVNDADSLKTAIEAGGTVALGGDITIESNVEHFCTIAEGKSVMLDLKGHTITVNDTRSSGNFDFFYILGEMTVKNGTIELTATTDRDWNAMSVIFHNRGGVLTIEDGTYKHLGGTDMAYVVDNSGNHYGDATTNIEGGTLDSTYTAIRNRMEKNSNGPSGKAILNVSGGTISGTTSAIWAQAASTSTTSPATGSINISGGTVGVINAARSNGVLCETVVSGGTVEKIKAEEKEVKITGGYVGALEILSADGASVASDSIISGGSVGSDYSSYCVEGYTCEVNTDGTYGVIIDPEQNVFVASVNGVGYTDFATAIANANGKTVTVLTDITLTDCITIEEGMNVTIEGAGKTITGADGKDVFYVTGGKLTLGEGLNVHAPTDCCIYIRGGEVVTAANLTKAGTKFSVIQGNGQYSGDVTITGGVVENQIPDKCAIYWPQNGKLTISGGVITGGTGIRLSSGSLEITGGTINANGTKQEYVASNGGSVVDTGEAVMLENIGGTSGYEAITSVSIKGGTFNSVNAAAVGSYDAGVGENVDAVDNFITGGTYSDESAESYLADGYTLDSYKDSNGTIIYGAKPVYTVSIICTPSDASIVVMDSDNKQVTAESDGTYMLVDGTYTYSVSKDGYDTKNDSFTVDGADQSITVELSEIEYNQGDSDLDKDGEQGDSDLDKDDEQSGDNQEDDATISDDDADSETDDEAEDTQSVKTADNANIGFPIMMLFAAMATMVVTLISRKRNR